VLNLAEARELASRAENDRLRLAVEALDNATLNVLKELGGVHGMPDVSDIVTNTILRHQFAGSGCDLSSLRLLGRDLRDL